MNKIHDLLIDETNRINHNTEIEIIDKKHFLFGKKGKIVGYSGSLFGQYIVKFNDKISDVYPYTTILVLPNQLKIIRDLS